MEKLNYEKVFCTLVDKTREYIQNNNLSAMVLGISGGIDSTVVAAICHEVSKQTGIPLIGRSLPIYKHADATFNESVIIGIEDCNSFCDYYYIVYVPESKQVVYELANSADFVKTIKI